MADTTVDAAVASVVDSKRGLWGPYWDGVSNGVIVSSDDGHDMDIWRTTNGGANWTKSEVRTGTIRQLAAYYDKETPDDTPVR